MDVKAKIIKLDMVDASEWEFAYGAEVFGKLLKAQVYGEHVTIICANVYNSFDIVLSDGTKVDAICDLHLCTTRNIKLHSI
ncbi:hypothetical protein Aeh1ORF056c [Aeromonas phage Aeh1]|uniref:Uncharacterized protein n=1 Tax=Aeromonas phage Aeh1 TaxID=2880362 RepID=Q76Z30_9CAUD|nr:hypothetical protein Aeh1p061 [Aeromonas phage Aeh1]AAQ17716.1 hypothetical protein Aeh1ORF056c [Aeromonas phage Aeh1]